MTLPGASADIESPRGVTPVADCYHCGLPVPGDLDLAVEIDGAARSMCCAGCQAVAQAIVAAGHENYYRVRTETAPTGDQLLPDFLRETQVYDRPEIQREFVRTLDADLRETSLILEGITCAACVWLNEQYLAARPGVVDVRVNYATQRAWIRWDDKRIKLSEILQAVRRIGYRALPFNPAQQQESQQRERRLQQRRLAVAGLFGMQVMMLSISLYAGAWSGMEAGFEQLFRWLNLGLTLPVILYSGLPFFSAAWRDLKRAQASMDLPVSLAIGGAFLASAWATWIGHGEVYFDSVVMFVFFLSASRYFETLARHRCAASVEQLVQSIPLTATRLHDSAEETVPATLLGVGDRILIRPGETVPADGDILQGFSAFDESLLNGESRPVEKSAGDAVLGGSVNLTQPLELRVTAVGADTVMAGIQRMIERAQSDRPPLARLADRVASRFIFGVLLVVGTVAVYWWYQDPARWFEIALAVLIVTCPCALSLATPTAISATLGRMMARGLLVSRASALEKLTRISHVVFDKTGTLTLGRPELEAILTADSIDREQVLACAAALENRSEHPLAHALLGAAGDVERRVVEQVENVPGGGLRGRIDGRDYVIGSADFVIGETGLELPSAWQTRLRDDGATAVILARADAMLALFCFRDRLRDDARELVEQLQAAGKQVILMTGDRAGAAAEIAAACGIEDTRADLSPEDKMDAVRALQAGGARVLMVGDGINDAPVLSAADVSIAMGGASAIAKVSADIVLLGNRLLAVAEALARAGRNQTIVRQNLAWALGYNISAIPAAAVGLVAPWAAAIGMSLSSLLVVLNATRLTR